MAGVEPLSGLETLDETSPKDTDPVSLGDDVIRETRAKVKASFGTEHYLDGPHKLPMGLQSTRPAAGRPGRLFYNRDTKELQFDDNTAWIAPGDSKARACVLWHNASINVPNGAVDFPLPFNSVAIDPFNYNNVASGEIIQPVNSMGLVSAYFELATGVTGFGATMTIQQFNAGAWYGLITVFALGKYINANTMVISSYGTQLRCVMTNATGAAVVINPTVIGNSPRFGYAMMGTLT